jgi:hypothetical protein
MTDGEIPEDIKRFLLEKIDSIAQWEGLLLMQAAPEKTWNGQEIAQNLYISLKETTQLLADLEAREIIESIRGQTPVLYRYRPCTVELDMVIKRTAKLYRQSLISITNIIHSKSKSRVQEFADAFRIRKD